MTSANPLDRVLSCPGLPTLPAVAIQVLELTRDPNVTVTQLARLVQADPSLSAKVLRTVNSSFFALPQACSKIDRALALLGLNTIKSLVLGFTLMEGTRGVPGDTGLDLTRHWRRALYSAAAARHVAVATGLCDPDEAFTAAMLQDIGMLACIVAIPEEYAPVILPSLKDHEPLPRAEQAALGFDHAHVGAALARKWRLPEHLAAAIAHHHAPDGAPAALQPLARTTWLGMLIAESLGIESPANAEARFLVTASEFLKRPPEELAPTLEKIAQGADALAKAFEREVGTRPDIKQILAQASEQMLETQLAAQSQASALAIENQALTLKATTDALTGALNRAALEAEGPPALARARAQGQPFAALFIDADRFKSVNDTHGHPAGDAVLVELARRLRGRVAEPARLYRYGGEEFAVLLPGTGREAAIELAERLRAEVEATPFDLARIPGAPAALAVTISLGVAAFDTPAEHHPGGVVALLKIADEGVYRAKQTGRNRVACVQQGPAATPVAAAAAPARPVAAVAGAVAGAGVGVAGAVVGSAPAGGSILLIEDDPLCARLIQTAVQKSTGAVVSWVTGVEEGLRFLRGQPGTGLVICDLHLGKASALELLCQMASLQARAGVHVVSSDDEPAVRGRCMAAGAVAFTSKHRISADLPGWCREIAQSLARAA